MRDSRNGTCLQFVLLSVGQLAQVDAVEFGSNSRCQGHHFGGSRKQVLLLGIGKKSAFSDWLLLERRPFDIREVGLDTRLDI